MTELKDAGFTIIAVLLMFFTIMFNANAGPRYYDSQRHGPRGHCCYVASSDNHVAKSMALVAVGLAVIAVMVSIEASESNQGQVVITKF